jgi:plasmid stabilization system protein ParE
MAYQVAWSPRAVEDLEAIAEYIAADSNAYAAAVVKTILNTARNLSRFPFAGRVVPELDDENTREWFAYGLQRRHSGIFDRFYKQGDKRLLKPLLDAGPTSSAGRYCSSKF